MEEINKLKSEIELLKAKLRRFLEDDETDRKKILEVNYKIDDLILKFYHLQNKDR